MRERRRWVILRRKKGKWEGADKGLKRVGGVYLREV